jgi:hypothetical protein
MRINFGLGLQPMGYTLALWTAFCLPDRKGPFPDKGLVSSVFGHYAPNTYELKAVARAAPAHWHMTTTGNQSAIQRSMIGSGD